MNKNNRVMRFIVAILFVSLLCNAFAVQVDAASKSKCKDEKPSDTPRIRRINARKDHVKLYTTAVAEHNSYYFVAYGFQKGDQRYGVQFDYGPMSGHWVKYTINSLTPNTTYYFSVRGGNGCKPGNWSTWEKVQTPKEGVKIYHFE